MCVSVNNVEPIKVGRFNMSKKTIDYDPVDNEEYNAVVIIKKITHLTKSNNIIRTLNARINSDN